MTVAKNRGGSVGMVYYHWRNHGKIADTEVQWEIENGLDTLERSFEFSVLRV